MVEHFVIFPFSVVIVTLTAAPRPPGSVRGVRGRFGVRVPRLPSRDDSLPQRPSVPRLPLGLLQEALREDHEASVSI